MAEHIEYPVTYGKLQSYAGLFVAVGAAIGAIVLTLTGVDSPLPKGTLTYLAALGAGLAAFGGSIAPRNGAQERASDPPQKGTP